MRFYLHGVDCDGEGRVVPVHLVLLAILLVSHGALVCSSDAEDAQDDHEHQEADAHHNDNSGGAGNHCEEANTQTNTKLQVGYELSSFYTQAHSLMKALLQLCAASSVRGHFKGFALMVCQL